MFSITFAFVISELMVGETEPSLLEVLHAKTIPPLSSFDHESGRSEGRRDRMLSLYHLSCLEVCVPARNILGSSLTVGPLTPVALG